PCATVPVGWTAEGKPVGDLLVRRSPWATGIFSCFGKGDEFFGSDVEVCLLGSIAPCVLHGSNSERLGAVPGTFSNHCWPYTGLYFIGNVLFGWNCLAPFYAYSNRTSIRRQFNLEGNCETMARSCGCLETTVAAMNDADREQWESGCDLAAHVLCHPCALCQEAREVRRKIPHPGLSLQPVIVMIPPAGQAMD
ncbi:hypothetical protein M569_14853, partial [Genlisea aurea]